MEIKKCNTCGRSYQSDKDFLIGTSRFRKCDLGHVWFNCACNSTLLLPKSMFALYNPEKKVSSLALRLFTELDGLKHLPPISHVVVRVEEALNNENTDAKTLSDILLNDPALSSKVLALSNVLSLASGTRVQSVQQAIGVLGREQLRSLCLASMIQKINFSFVNFSVAEHWKHSLVAGQLARKISELIYGNPVDDICYLTTVLSNMGRLVLGLVFAAELELMSAKVTRDKISWTYAESSTGSYSHALLGEIGAAMWGLPNEVLVVCGKHHDIAFIHDPLQNLRKTKDFASLKDSGRDEMLTLVAMLSNDFAHDILQQPWRKSSAASLSQAGLSALYGKNLTPAKLVPTVTLDGIYSAAKLFV